MTRLCRAALAAGLAALAGCGLQAPPSGPGLRLDGQRLRHPDGLEVTLPAGYRAEQTPSGFRLAPLHDGGREPIEIFVDWAPTPVPASVDRRFDLPGGRVLHYAVRSEPAVGSGGAPYTLHACEAVRAGSVCVRQTRQSSTGEPAFEAWDVAPGVRFSPP